MPSGRWRSSDRSERLPANWPELRRAVKARAHGRCQADEHAVDCPGTGRECDHVIPGDDHSLDNLQWLSTECHKVKTQREAQEAAMRFRRQRRRDPEAHPGEL